MHREKIYGLMAEFTGPEEVTEATRRTVEVLGLCPSCITSAETGPKEGEDAL